MKKYLLFLLIGLFWAIGCTEKTDVTPTIDNSTDRKAMLTYLADNVIIPSYTNFKVKFDVMMARSEAFTAQPSAATLTAFRTAWVDAYVEWQKVELFDFGPAERHTLRNFFNIYPTNEASIVANMADPSVNLDLATTYAHQGFPALDYLINGVGNSDATIVAYYTVGNEAPKRIDYLKRLTTRMNTLLTKVMSEWSGAYRETYITKTGLDAGSSTSLMVNGLVHHYERFIRSGKFGIPSGAIMSGVISPEKVEAFYKKDISLTLAKTAHQAVMDFFNGKSVTTGSSGASFKAYLDALGAKDKTSGKTLAELINAQFEVAKGTMEGLKPNLSEEVKTNNAAMKNVFTEMQKAVRMMKVDMTSAMSITITYTDNDGD